MAIEAPVDDFLHTFFDWHEIGSVLPTLLTEGLGNTLLIAALAIVLGLASPGETPATAAQAQAKEDEVGDQNHHTDDQQVEKALRHHTDDAEHDGHKDQ